MPERAFTPQQAAEMKRLYVDEHYTTPEIGEMMYCHQTTVRKYLRLQGVKLRRRDQASLTRRVTVYDSQEIERIRFLYEDAHWTMRQIGDFLGESRFYVRTRMVHGGIPRRNRSESQNVKPLPLDEALRRRSRRVA